MTFEDLLRYIAILVCVVGLILFVIPGIFWASVGIIWSLFILAVWGIAGFILIKIILECLKKGGKNGK